MLSLDDVDRLLSTEKSLGGKATWREDPANAARALLVVPLLIDGVAVGGLQLQGNALVRVPQQSVTLLLIADGDPIQRISLMPRQDHVNSLRSDLPRELRGRRLPAGNARFYPWSLNRRWPREHRPRERYDGLVLETPAPAFDEAAVFFLAECNIVGEVPPPPHRPELF